ncbi:unnamed protein product [Periconia digitata]|uniref:Zn(2)-C6 fungal-type domain-containing protein n=1 Tax=Periconia digitata TaxID=1303443 RepID=A0A9W4XIE7_9PLEO|nr:unnamed protein product [Periconia digitata]
MPIRKAHSKSRNGCLPCKKRHIKCGEEYPSCQNCIKRLVSCAYDNSVTPTSQAAARNTSPGNGHLAQYGPSDTPQATLNCSCQQSAMNLAPVGITRLQELRLVIHYTTITCETMSHGSTDIDIWKQVVPGEAVLHEFLMDGLLALSSLHFASQNPNLRWQYTEIAIKYQTAGLQKYKYALEKITKDNSDALFAFSVIINILALAFPNVCPDPTHSSHTEGIIMLLELLQGTGFINDIDASSFREGKLAALFEAFPFTMEEHTLSNDTTDALLKLRERADSLADTIDSEQQKSYVMGIDSLETVFGYMSKSQHLGPIISWPAMAGKGLVRLFKQNDPMAQFIFIHYGVLLLYARDRWWAKHTGVNVIENLASSLHDADPEWVTWTQWARDCAALVVEDNQYQN